MCPECRRPLIRMGARELAEAKRLPRASLAVLPTAVHPLRRLTEALGGPEIWVKRDDLTGLAGGGNKTRKLEFLVGEALALGADTLVTVGAIQSNHTRQTAAAAARHGLDCVLLHNGWAPDAGPYYRKVGNILMSSLLGATLLYDAEPRHIDDQGALTELVERLREQGKRPYLIPGGASDHPLGGIGYALAANEILDQAEALGVRFDRIVHCTGSSGTQAGLLAGATLSNSDIRVTGIADDDETEEKKRRVLRLANQTLERLGAAPTIDHSSVDVVVGDPNPYGVAAPETLAAIRLLARSEGIIADPVYEGKAIAGLRTLVGSGAIAADERVLLLHLGGTPAIHAYANQLWDGELTQLGGIP